MQGAELIVIAVILGAAVYLIAAFRSFLGGTSTCGGCGGDGCKPEAPRPVTLDAPRRRDADAPSAAE